MVECGEIVKVLAKGGKSEKKINFYLERGRSGWTSVQILREPSPWALKDLEVPSSMFLSTNLRNPVFYTFYIFVFPIAYILFKGQNYFLSVLYL